MNDVVAAIRALLEPEPVDPDVRTVAVDETCARPFTWDAETLYAWLEAVADVPIETGPTAREDFDIRVVLTGPQEGEEAQQERSLVVSSYLDTKRDAYLATLRANQHSALWANLRAASGPAPATLQVRGFGLRLTGYRILG